MGKSLTEAAKLVLENANADTLKPKSQHADAPETLATPDKIGDAPVKPGEGNNLGAAASAPIKKDKSAPTKTAKAPEPAQHLEEDEEVECEGIQEEDDIELSEELEEFIDQCIAEGMSEEEIEEAIAENFELVTEEEDESLEEEEEAEELEEHVIDMSEHVNALLEGETLSEEFKEKATTIFEAAVRTKLEEERNLMEEAYAVALEEAVEDIKEELAQNIDDYLNYVTEQWMLENEVAIEASLRTELTEDFINSLRQVFAEHYIEIPADKVDILEEMGSKIEELTEKLNEEIESNVALNKALNESTKSLVVNDLTDGLTSAQAEKLKELAESVEFTDVEEFAEKIQTLRESYFPTNSVTPQKELDSSEIADGRSMIQEDLQGPMAKYVQVLGKKLPN